MAAAIHSMKMDAILNNDRLIDDLEAIYNNHILQLLHQKLCIQREIRRQCYQQLLYFDLLLTKRLNQENDVPMTMNTHDISQNNQTLQCPQTAQGPPQAIKTESLDSPNPFTNGMKPSIPPIPVIVNSSSAPQLPRFRFNRNVANQRLKAMKREHAPSDVLAPIEDIQDIDPIDGDIQSADDINDSPPQNAFTNDTNNTNHKHNVQALNGQQSSSISQSQRVPPLPLKCAYCPYSPTNQELMDAHASAHYAERPRVCPYCSKRFRSNNNLQHHVRTHTGEKPFKCNHKGCSKAFTTKSSLNNHMRIHTGSKPFRCSKCMKSFRISGQMRKHKCVAVTKKEESDGATMRETAVIMTPDRREQWKCQEPGCSMVFGSGRSLAGHMNLHRRRTPRTPS